MALPSSNAFAKALHTFGDSLTDEQKKSFSVSSLNDVEREIKRIQHNYGQRKELRNMKRLAKFLEGMQQVEELVTIFLNVHEVVAFVWGPIKFVLNIAKNRLETFELLLDTYVEIGEVISGLRQYEQIFQDYPSVREVLERCFYDILEFHRAALDMFKRTRWEKYFDSTWKTFKTRFKPILDSLKRHRALLLDEKLTAAILEVQAGRGESQTRHLAIEARFSELSSHVNDILEEARDKEARNLHESLTRRRHFISEQLAPGNYEDDQQSASLQYSSSPSEDWILRDERFKAWLQSKPNTGSVLYLHGMPGAGKTILVSRIVNYLRSQTDALNGPVLFFYFKSSEEDKRSLSYMIRALLDQLIYQDDTLVDLLYPKCSSISHIKLRTLSTLKELLEDCILTPRGCTIVLDGLDECQDEQQTNGEGPRSIIDWINNILIPEFTKKGSTARFLLSSQHVDFLETELTRHPSIALDQHAGHLRNIQAYAQSQASVVQSKFELSKSDTDALAQKVAATSNGFFLYAKVVLKNLMDQGSKGELKHELAEQNFPGNLNEAYERVVIRVLDRGSQSKRAAALKIFGWMICSFRPLSWNEIQSRFCIDPSLGHCDSDAYRADGYKTICGSLVDREEVHESLMETPHTVVKFVHNTAGRYLVHTGRLNVLDRHVDAAFFCSRYLVSRPLQEELQDSIIEEHALSGYYGFLDYVASFWIRHLSCALESIDGVPGQTGPDLHDAAVRVFQSYGISEPCPSSSSSSSKTTYQDVLAMLNDWHGSGSEYHLEKQVSNIREVIESFRVSDMAESDRTCFLRFNGNLSFKCPKSDCHNFNRGFLSSESRDSHLNNHERPFKCLVSGCYLEDIGLRSQLELQTHTRIQHPVPGNPKLFPKPKLKNKVDIFDACVTGDLDSVQVYLDQGGDVNQPGRTKAELTPLILAARHGHLHVCGLLIDNGATKVLSWTEDRFSKPAPTAFLEAIHQENSDLLWYLAHKANQQQKELFEKDYNSHSYLKKAIASRDDQILQCNLSLLDPNKSLDPFDLLNRVVSRTTSASKLNIALKWATAPATSGDCRANGPGQKYPLSKDSKTIDEHTALRIACKKANLTLIRFLLRRLRHQDINKDNSHSLTPLLTTFWSRNRYSKEIVELLLDADKGAAANIKDQDGSLPIHLYISTWERATLSAWDRTIMELLCKYTEDLNTEDAQGSTPLISAIDHNNTELVRILLKTKRVDILKRNRHGNTAADHAIRRVGRFQMLKILKEHNPAVLDTTPVTNYLERLLEGSSAASMLTKLYLVLKHHPKWLIKQLVAADKVAIAKECLSEQPGVVPMVEMLGVWEVVEEETDVELRALVLLQAHLSQDVWQRQLPDIKGILEPPSAPKFLLRLLTLAQHAQQVLIEQAELQNDEELRNLLLQHGFG